MADCQRSGCPKDGGECSHSSYGKEKGDDYECPITAKFFKKAHFILENKDEIGLSEDQVKAIKALKMDVKKNYIRGMAEMQVGFMEIESKMSEDKIDVEGINAMLDQQVVGMTGGVNGVLLPRAMMP